MSMYEKPRSVYKIARELKERIETAVPWSLTFYNYEMDRYAHPALAITKEQRAALEKYLREYFFLWANTWIVPLADEILAKHPDAKKESRP